MVRVSKTVESTRVVTSELEDEDDIHLARAGKRPQLKREWGFWAISGFAVVNLCTWEASGTLIGPAFVNGGSCAVLYSFFASTIGMLVIYASLAEMASMYPVAGAEYHWAAIFATPRWRPFMSYIQGWTTTFAWQCVVAAAFFLVASLIQGMAILGQATYVPERYQVTLIMIASALICVLIVVFFKRFLPAIMVVTGVLHVVIFFAVIIPMLALSSKASSDFVWKGFENNGGWSNNGISFVLGFLAPCFALLGADGIVHMAEECHRPRVNIPRAIMISLGVNATLGFVFLIVALYSISDVTAVLETPTGFPILEIFVQATHSIAGAIVMQSLIVVIWIGASLCVVAGSSSRDGGVPFSSFIAHVDARTRAPLRAISVTFSITVALSLIVIGSDVALEALLSLATIAIYFSYLLLISNFLFFRIRNADNLTYGPWRLGRLGVPVNIAAVGFCIFLIVFLPFPTVLPVTAQNMNYSGPILGTVLVIAVLNWVINARKHFTGPIIEIDLQVKVEGTEKEKSVE